MSDPRGERELQTRTPGNAPNENTSSTLTSIPQKRNAFTELKWSVPKPKQQKTDHTKHNNSEHKYSHNNSFVSGLLPYILNPDSFTTTTVLRKTDHSILIRDRYPKALVHLLLLPRDPALYDLTPFQAFNKTNDPPQDTAFLDLMRSEAASAVKLAASELSRLVSPYSATCKARNDFLLNNDDAVPEPSSEESAGAIDISDADIPPARDFLQDFKVGIHAEPSMSTLHIHIVSVDNYSAALKHKKHYNSFNSKFFIPLSDFPLAEDDERMQAEKQGEYIKGDMRCWRCSKNYRNKFKDLQAHLEDEYHEWRKV